MQEPTRGAAETGAEPCFRDWQGQEGERREGFPQEAERTPKEGQRGSGEGRDKEAAEETQVWYASDSGVLSPLLLIVPPL